MVHFFLTICTFRGLYISMEHSQATGNIQKKPDIRELTLKNGIAFPSNEELLMLMLNKGTKQMPVEKLAQKVLSTVNTCNREDIVSELKNIPGIGDTKALTVAAAIEFGRRRNLSRHCVIDHPSDIIPYVQHYAIEPKEHFICASLNGAHEVLNIRVVSIGTTTRTLVHPRELYADPVAEHAAGIICCHNHPFGSCLPSQADIDATKLLQSAADILGITFMDHIIITRESYFSFLEHSML